MSKPISATITLATVAAHSRDGHEPFDDRTKGFERSLDLRLELTHALFQMLDHVQMLLE
jgi:hypothetical protein